MSNYNYIGIDALVLSNVAVIPESVNLEKLCEMKKVKFLYSSIRSQNSAWNYNGQPINCIQIIDNQYFADLLIYWDTYNNANSPMVATLSLKVNYVQGNNRDNLTYIEYCEWINYYVIPYIRDEYGVELIMQKPLIKNIEINCNVNTSFTFEEAKRPLSLIASTVPCNRQPEPKEYIKVGNASLILKIYDKNLEMLQSGEEPPTRDPLIRFELEVKEHKKIKQMLGTNQWKEIDDITVCDCFNKYMGERKEKIEWWKETQNNKLIKLIKQHKKESKNHWISNLMEDIRNKEVYEEKIYMLDIDQLLDAYDSYVQKSKNESLKKHKNRTKESLEKNRIENNIYFNNDCAKIKEIFYKLDDSYANTLEMLEKLEGEYTASTDGTPKILKNSDK